MMRIVVRFRNGEGQYRAVTPTKCCCPSRRGVGRTPSSQNLKIVYRTAAAEVCSRVIMPRLMFAMSASTAAAVINPVARSAAYVVLRGEGGEVPRRASNALRWCAALARAGAVRACSSSTDGKPVERGKRVVRHVKPVARYMNGGVASRHAVRRAFAPSPPRLSPWYRKGNVVPAIPQQRRKVRYLMRVAYRRCGASPLPREGVRSTC